MAFTTTFHGGVNVAVGDFNGDGTADVICGEGAGGLGVLTVFDGKSMYVSGPVGVISSFQPYGSYNGAIRVSAKSESGGDIGTNDQCDILIGYGTGNSSRNVRRAKFNLSNPGSPTLTDEQIMGVPFSGGAFVG